MMPPSSNTIWPTARPSSRPGDGAAGAQRINRRKIFHQTDHGENALEHRNQHRIAQPNAPLRRSPRCQPTTVPDSTRVRQRAAGKNDDQHRQREKSRHRKRKKTRRRQSQRRQQRHPAKNDAQPAHKIQLRSRLRDKAPPCPSSSGNRTAPCRSGSRTGSVSTPFSSKRLAEWEIHGTCPAEAHRVHSAKDWFFPDLPATIMPP